MNISMTTTTNPVWRLKLMMVLVGFVIATFLALGASLVFPGTAAADGLCPSSFNLWTGWQPGARPDRDADGTICYQYNDQAEKYTFINDH